MSTDDRRIITVSNELMEVKEPRDPEVLPPEASTLTKWDGSKDQASEILSQTMPYLDGTIREALTAWLSDEVRSDVSRKAYMGDLRLFWWRMKTQGVGPYEVVGNHVRLYKDALKKSGMRNSSVCRQLSAIRGAYLALAINGLIPWNVAQDIKAIKGLKVRKNSTPALSNKQANHLLDAIQTVTLKGKRDLALIWTYLVTACRASAPINSKVGGITTDGDDYFLHVLEKGDNERELILLDAAPAVLEYIDVAGIKDDPQGPLFRPMTRDGLGLERRQMNRRTPLRLVKYYCRIAGIDPERVEGRGISTHSLRKTALNDAIANGAPMHHVQGLAGHADIRSTQIYYIPDQKDAYEAARRIRIGPTKADKPRKPVAATTGASTPPSREVFE